MGIDCPDIRVIVHWGPPHDLDAYVQESGQAGRDGRQVHAHMFYEATNPHQVNTCKNCQRTLLFKHFILALKFHLFRLVVIFVILHSLTIVIINLVFFTQPCGLVSTCRIVAELLQYV